MFTVGENKCCTEMIKTAGVACNARGGVMGPCMLVIDGDDVGDDDDAVGEA